MMKSMKKNLLLVLGVKKFFHIKNISEACLRLFVNVTNNAIKK